jgi:hypothetical protein
MRIFLALLTLAGFGAARWPAEQSLAAAAHRLHLRSVTFDLTLREQIGQAGFVAALSGFRAFVADMLFIQTQMAWERTDWGRLLLLFRQITTLQPRTVLFWDMAAWHMAWNASTAAMHDSSQSRFALRVKAEREYLALGRDFLQRGIQNNPDSAQLYEALARLYRDKYHDHLRASEFFEKAAAQLNAPSYERRFSAYELSHCAGREHEAYERLHAIYLNGEEERLPTLITRLKLLEEQLNIPAAERIPDKLRPHR